MDNQPRFSNGASYDVMMGVWSRQVGEVFLDWLAAPRGSKWIDVGCGSGAFTQLVVERCDPVSILGVDPSPEQLDFARRRGIGDLARFEAGDAMALDAAGAAFDVAAAALVMHFMPQPRQGVAEMKRVTRPGGIVAAYVWDQNGGGFPYSAMHAGMRAFGAPAPQPPHPEAGSTDELLRLWTEAGLADIAQREIVVARPFRDFDQYWEIAATSSRIGMALETLPAARLAELKDSVRAMLPALADGSVIPTGRANAIRGRVPK